MSQAITPPWGRAGWTRGGYPIWRSDSKVLQLEFDLNEAETEIGGEAFAGDSQGHSQELRSQESCSGEGIVKGQST